MKPIRNIFFLIVIIVLHSCINQENSKSVSEVSVSNTYLNKVEPTNWWVNMKNDELQLLIHHPNISEYTPEINYTGISIKKVTPSEKSNNYLFVDIIIA